MRYFYQAHPVKPEEVLAEEEGLSWCSSDGVFGAFPLPFLCVLSFLPGMHG